MLKTLEGSCTWFSEGWNLTFRKFEIVKCAIWNLESEKFRFEQFEVLQSEIDNWKIRHMETNTLNIGQL